MTECGVLPFRVSHKTLLSVLDSLSRMHFREYELHLIGGFSLALTGVREYRTADCIEFGCTNPDAFREFCNDIRESGIVNLFESGKALKLVKRDRPVIFDRGYSCRLFFYAPLQESDKKIPVKCEVMREVRIAFDPSGRTIFGFPALSVDDCFALNLMGNADRRQDSPPMFRDVLDIFALLDAEGLERMPERALYKANEAYGNAEKRYILALRLLGDSRLFAAACNELHIETDDVSVLEKRLQQQTQLYGTEPDGCREQTIDKER